MVRTASFKIDLNQIKQQQEEDSIKDLEIVETLSSNFPGLIENQAQEYNIFESQERFERKAEEQNPKNDDISYQEYEKEQEKDEF